MLINSKKNILCFIAVLFLTNISFYSWGQSIKSNGLIIDCFILKPVKNDSKADTVRALQIPPYSLDYFLDSIATSSPKCLSYDSAMDFVTSFEYQKIILVNSLCFKNLNKPDSCDLMDIYFDSRFRTSVFTKSIIKFLRSYKEDILNFGDALIFEYKFEDVAEDEPHFMYIILKDQTSEQNEYAEDYHGYVICSDGLEWKNFGKNQNKSMPIFIQKIIRGKMLLIPLYFDHSRFIPIGHFENISTSL
jgi:hypothetical protein